jgi:1-acyl-sn-glycerol-3-phosphate acyltransferase
MQSLKDRILGVLSLFILIFATLILLIISYPLFLSSRYGKISTWYMRTWSLMTIWMTGAKIKVEGVENIPPGPVLLLANHQSFFDITSLLWAFPRALRMVAKKELFSVPFFGWGITIYGFIPIDRSNHIKAVASLDEAARRIRNGIPVLLFPEGTRSRDGKLQAFKKGSFELALKAGVPIVPVLLTGTIDVHHKDHFLRIGVGKKIRVYFEKPISLDGFQKANRDQLMLQVHEVMRTRLELMRQT